MARAASHPQEGDIAEVEDQGMKRADGIELLGQDFACPEAQRTAHLQQQDLIARLAEELLLLGREQVCLIRFNSATETAGRLLLLLILALQAEQVGQKHPHQHGGDQIPEHREQEHQPHKRGGAQRQPWCAK